MGNSDWNNVTNSICFFREEMGFFGVFYMHYNCNCTFGNDNIQSCKKSS